MTDEQATPAPTPPWRITWRGKSWGESDMQGRHLSILALINGRDDFDQLDISPTQGHQRLMQCITAFLAADVAAEMTDVEDPEQVTHAVASCLKQVAEASVEEILGALTYDD